MTVLGLLLAIATWLGTIVGQSTPACLVTIPLVAFFVAVYGSSSQAASSAGVQALCLLIVLAGLNLPPGGAIGNGLLVLGGAAVQVLLLLVLMQFLRRDPERRAVAAAFESMAQFVECLPDRIQGPIPSSKAIQNARSVLAEAQAISHADEFETLDAATRLAETLRACLVGYGEAAESVAYLGHDATEEINRLRDELRPALLRLAKEVRSGTAQTPIQLSNVKPVHIEQEGLDHSAWTEFTRWHAIVQGVLATPIPRAPQKPSPSAAPYAPATQPRSLAARIISRLTTLPAIPTFDRMVMRHALRYSITVGIAEGAITAFPFPHSYWLPLTVAIVLRSDFNGTLSRGLARLVGTGAGVLLASLIAALLHPSANTEGILVIVATWLLFAFFGPSYTLYSFGITLYVVFSVAASTHQEREIGLTRLAATAVGMSMAYFAYYIAPALHWKEMWEVLKEAVRSQVDYGRAVLARGESGAHDERYYARSLRVQAEHLYEAAEVEPRGISRNELARARAAILQVDENAALMLASSVKPGATEELRRLIASSEDLLKRLDQ